MSPRMQRLDAWFRKHRPKHYKYLLPGATDNELSSFERRQKVTLPAVFKEFFLWRNGEDLDRIEGRFQGNWSVMSLKEVEETCDFMRELVEAREFEEKNWWVPGWIPFLANGGGDHLCVDLTGAFVKGRSGQVLEFYHDEPRRTIHYPSMEAWLDFFVATLEEGLWVYDEEGGYFEMKESDLRKSMKKKCPGYPIKKAAR